ncbi:MAG: type II secretion system protein [Planctomycetales bacterium]|nr:type II secretion system protein [Planctomycetales bacterium]
MANSFRNRRLSCVHRSRYGYTMVHMLVALTLMSALLAVSATVIVRIVDAEAVMRQNAEWQVTATRLDETLRADANGASSVQLDDQTIRLATKSGRIELVWDGKATAIRRTEYDQDGTVTLRDSFLMPHDAAVEWLIEDGPDQSRFVSLRVSRPQPDAPPKLLFHTVAHVNRYQKLTNGDSQ